MPFKLRNLCQLWIPDNTRAGEGAYTYTVRLHNRLSGTGLAGSSGPLSWFFCTVVCQLIWAHSWERLHFPKTASVECYVMKISVCRAVLMALAALLCPADSTVTARHHSVSSGVWSTRSTLGMAWEVMYICDVLEWTYRAQPYVWLCNKSSVTSQCPLSLLRSDLKTRAEKPWHFTSHWSHCWDRKHRWETQHKLA